MAASKLTACLACGSRGLRLALDLGSQPPANLLLDSLADRYPTYPLALNYCPDCGHGQLSHAVQPEELFGRGYKYVSGGSKTHERFFAWFAETLASILPAGARVLDIGSNDGSLLKPLKERGLNCTGVEPDKELAKLSNRYTATINAFWPLADWLGDASYDAVVALNVFAHGPEPKRFLQAVERALKPNGIALILCSQSDMLDSCQFDCIYHEHISYFNADSMCKLANRCSMTLRAEYRVAMHGVSSLYVLSKSGHRLTQDFSVFAREPLGSFAPPKQLYQYGAYAANVKQHIKTISVILRSAKHQHKGVPKITIFVGASAKAICVLHATRVKPDLVVDESKLKTYKWIPQVGRSIQPFSSLSIPQGSILAVLSAWNFAEELEAKVRAVRKGLPTEFLTYFPEMRRWS